MKFYIILLLYLSVSFATIYADSNNPRKIPEGKLKQVSKGKGSNNDDFTLLVLYHLITFFPEILLEFRNEDEYLYGGTFWDRGYNKYPYYENKGTLDVGSSSFMNLEIEASAFNPGGIINGLNFRTKTGLGPGFNIKIDHQRFREHSLIASSNLHLTDVLFNYNRIRAERFVLHWGIGYRNLYFEELGSKESLHTFAINAGFEWFLFKPISLSGNYTLAAGETDIQNFRLQLNYFINRFKIFAGYESLNSTNSITISNFALGTGITF